MKYDVVVVGAGVAGLNTAYEIASKGFNVAIIESKPRNRIGDKTCGDAIGTHHFNELGWKPSEDIIDHIYSGVKIYDPTEEYAIEVPGEGVSVNRIKFGQWLLKRALDHGAILLDRHVLLKIVVSNNFVVKALVKESGKPGLKEVEGKVFVDASGAKPALRTKLPLEWPVSERPYMTDYNIAYREVVELEKPLEKDIEYAVIYLNTEIAPGGYWWFFPKSRDGLIVNVGLGVIWDGKYNPRFNYERYLRKRFSGKLIHRGGGLVPTRRPLPTLVWRNVVVVGDAAYTVNPVHGGGIGSSLLASSIVSKYIIESLEKGVINEETMWGMNREYMVAYGAKQASLDILRMYLQKLSDEDFTWLIKNRIVDGESIYMLSSKADLAREIVHNISSMLRLLGKPSILNQLRTLKKYMDLVKKLYLDNYPDKPSELAKWIVEVERIYDKYRSIIGYDPGERVKW
ncbi:MAG: geranylgeranyl reductase [Desulfurococcales archaeon ex4484_58]|nr:MAG: geranylgeranyl reductase [Desulfurococcales archaeon ex4484_58]